MSVEAMSWAYQQRLGRPAVKFVLVVLGDYADEGGYSYVEPSSLANITDQTVAQTRRCLAALQLAGKIRREPGERADGTWTLNRFHLLMDEACEPPWAATNLPLPLRSPRRR